MVYDFDNVYERDSTKSAKWSLRKQLTGIEDVLPMWVADMDFACAPEIVEAMRKRVNHPIYGYTASSDAYFDGQIRWMEKRHGWSGVQRDWICFSPGVVSAFDFTIQAYTRPGDKVILQPPVYYPMKMGIDSNGRRMLENPLKIIDGKYVMDFEDLERKIDERTRMIILCSPHNPVGRVWKRGELEQLEEICRKHDLIIVSDEIHNDLILGETPHTCLATLSEDALQRTITLVSPSKTFNLAGLANSSAIIPNKRLRDTFLATTESCGIHFANTFGMVSQEAAYSSGEAWLDELITYLRGNRKYLTDFLRNRIPGLVMYPLEGTYLAWVDCSSLGLNDAELKEFMLKKAKLWLDEGTMFGSGGSMFMRFNIACPRSILRTALERLEGAVKELST